MVGRSTVLVRPNPIQILYVCFVRNDTLFSDISNCTSLSTLMDSSFPTFAITGFAIFSTLCAILSSDLVGFSFFPASTTLVATLFPVVSLGPVLGHRSPILKDLSRGLWISSTKGSAQASFASSFLLLHALVSISLHSLRIMIARRPQQILFRSTEPIGLENRLVNPYYVLWGNVLCHCSVFKLFVSYYMILAHNFMGTSE